MSETNAAGKDALPGATQGQPSEGKDGSTSKPETTRTYTETEHQAAITKARSDALAEAGRKYKPVEEENATLKSQLATNQSSIKDTRGQIAKLEEQIEELAADDPDKTKLAAKLKALEKTENDLDPPGIPDQRGGGGVRGRKSDQTEGPVRNLQCHFRGADTEGGGQSLE